MRVIQCHAHRPVFARLAGQHRPRLISRSSHASTYPRKESDALRILYCGSDAFSVGSLEKLVLHKEELNIKSIDVVCKPPKPVGRGFKQQRDVPIKGVAEKLALPIHQIDTFTGWQPPRPEDEPINLILAVSFGLLVPKRLLDGARYGGLNVHPSLLPDLRGPAPLHHTLLQRREHIGITLQTLHPTHFDRGVVLAQTPPPGLWIPAEHRAATSKLIEFVTPRAADLLLQGLRARVYVPPLHDVGRSADDKGVFPHGIRHAPKLTRDDARADWRRLDVQEILARQRAIGPVWSMLTPLALGAESSGDGRDANAKAKRVNFDELRELGAEEAEAVLSGVTGPASSRMPGALQTIDSQDGRRLVVYAQGGRLLLVERVTVDGGPSNAPPLKALKGLDPGVSGVWEYCMR